jgi:hypothetical protein
MNLVMEKKKILEATESFGKLEGADAGSCF